MAKSKRKSDGDILAINKKRKTTCSSSPSSSASEDEEEATQQSSQDGLFISPDTPKSKAKSSKKSTSKAASKRKSRKSEPIKKVARFDVDDEDEEDGAGSEDEDGGGGGMDSQDFLKIVELQQKKKAQEARLTSEFMTDFTNTAEEEEQSMLKQLDTLKKESTTRDTTFLTTFTSLLAVSRPKPAIPSPDDTISSFQALKERSVNLISNAYAILENIAEADKLTANLHVTNIIDTTEFNKTSLATGLSLRGGMAIGRRRTKAWLYDMTVEEVKAQERAEKAKKSTHAGHREEEERADYLEGEGDELERSLYGERGSDEEEKRGWGYCAKKYEKDLAKMSKCNQEFATKVEV